MTKLVEVKQNNHKKKIIIKVSLIFLISLIYTYSCYSQENNGAIRGKVSDLQNNPLHNVSVIIETTQIGTTTDPLGSFYLKNIPAQRYTLTFSHVGYKTVKKNVSVPESGTIEFKIVLPEEDLSLEEITVTDSRNTTEISRLPDIYNTYIIAGKKNEVVSLTNINANLAEKTGRQIFSKIPGVFVYDMDGSGNQVNISTRGLDPHRSWEYNVRQNGIMMNSDIYGYPASHYSPPMESIQKIELVRGTASLQYGAMLGGMINYITKQPDTTKSISFESLNSTGSFGLFSSYNAIGGKVGKLQYYAYYSKRISEGYRQNSRSNYDAQFASLIYQFTPTISLRAELGHMKYIYQIPGPLTDSMFYANPRQSTRSRNYFNPNIYLPSLSLNWHINSTTKLNLVTSAVLGNRNSVQIIAFANVPDKIDSITNQYKPRQVDIDNFNSYTSELRLIKEYSIGKLQNVVTGGIRYINNDLHRRQLGKGTTGTDFDLTVSDQGWGRDLHYRTQNIAFFVENLFYFTPKFSVSPGFRYESGRTDMSGYINYLQPENVPNQIKHKFPLFGLNVEYKINPGNRLYAGFSQSYRPVIFADVIPPTALDKTDPNLKDALGYNAELGASGKFKQFIKYDFSVFQIQYNNRIGSLILNDTNGQPYVFKTNVGNSITNGIELFLELNLLKKKNTDVFIFTSTSYFDAYYSKGSLVTDNENKSIKGNRLETVPKWISRNGINFSYKKLNATLLYSYVSKSFSDALNTVTPSSNGAKGIVPSYGILDFNTSLRIADNYVLKFGMNNLFNKQYFTKRPSGYPGPGVWSSDGRSFIITFDIKI